MNNISRRSFIKRSVATAATVSLSAHAWQRVLGANDAIRVACVGFKGRGGSHIDAFSKMSGVRLVALCDVDQQVLAGAAKRLEQHNPSLETYTDVRKLLENKDIDVISTATPNHWHALISVWACQAGKDVYVEKPVSHNVWEGRQIVLAARKHKRIVQTGTQSRSSSGIEIGRASCRERVYSSV